ncbi:MAG: ParA family protein [Alphaproteobacteria bacterium]|jgi:chromosome partitioning protein|nr:ParA family protein [Alphaproteobacteria bacterium]MBP7729592.1 ParA family protein [Alphaproteobacteria bacterium]
MTKIVAVVNQKGGVGKTTTTLNLATAFSTIGKKILVIDFDPQGNATTGLGVSNKKNIVGSYETLIGKNQFENGYQETCIPNLYLMPASIHLSGAEIELVNIKGREKLLSKVMKDVEKFDFVFIDCPPSLGLLTLNALVAADEVLIPLQCEFYALEGLSQILFTISQVQKKFNPGLSLQGIVLTMFDGRSSLCFQVANDVRQHLKDKVYKTYIPRNVRVAEAPSFGKPVVIYDYKCQGSQAYLQLAREILAQKGKLAA